MKKHGILHPEVSHLLASTGHTDFFAITDGGFPVPEGPVRIDLALIDDIPTVLDVLKAVHAEFYIDRVVITTEMEEISPGRVAEMRELLGDIPIEAISHLEFKHLAHESKGTIRTADTCPYANLIVVSG